MLHLKKITQNSFIKINFLFVNPEQFNDDSRRTHRCPATYNMPLIAATTSWVWKTGARIWNQSTDSYKFPTQKIMGAENFSTLPLNFLTASKLGIYNPKYCTFERKFSDKNNIFLSG